MSTSGQNQTQQSSSKPGNSLGKEKEDSAYYRRSVDTLPRYTEYPDPSQQGASTKAKSKFSSTLDNIKSKMGREPDTPERAAEKAAEKARREEDYTRLGLGERTRFGSGGMSWSG